MGRSELERLSREELIELVLRLQRPEKTSRTSSKPPATDRKEQREQSKPGGAKPGHEGHSRVLSVDPDAVVEHRPEACACCGGVLPGDLCAEIVSVSERIELPEVAPVVTQHRRLAVRCPSCGERVVAPVPQAARGTPFGTRLHAAATYLKTCQALSYERLQAALSDLFGLTLSQGGLMNLLRRAQGCFGPGRDAAIATLRRTKVVACDETGVRIEGSNGDDPVSWRLQLWLQNVFALAERVTHLAASTLSAKRRSLDRQLGAILATPSRCDLTRNLQAKISRARDQLLVFLAYPGKVEPTNNGSERLLRPAVVQRKVTNGYRAMWAAEGEVAIRTVVDTARLTGSSPFGAILKTIGA